MNASTMQSQEDCLKKYEATTKQYEATASEIDGTFLPHLQKQPKVLNKWNGTIWTLIVKKAIVHMDGNIIFIFFNRTEIKVGA